MDDKGFNKEKWDEMQETLMIGGALLLWLLHTAAIVLVSDFADHDASRVTGRFIDSIILMLFTFKFTKSQPGGRNATK